MIPQANITAWRANAPWADDAQVEQDLALTRALVELFSNPDLAGRIALRGGSALQNLRNGGRGRPWRKPLQTRTAGSAGTGSGTRLG